MTLPTGSGLYRAANCAASAALPQADAQSPAGAQGTECHGYLERIPGIGEEASLGLVAEFARDRAQGIELDSLPLDPALYRQEVAFAFDVGTGEARELGVGLKRRYGVVGPDELVGTFDVVSKGPLVPLGLADPVLYVGDYKIEGYESYTPAVRSNYQTLLGALCLSRLAPGPDVMMELLHIRPDGHCHHERALVDEFDLDTFAVELRRVAASVRRAEAQYKAGEVLDVRRGPWCRYCPAMAYCPPMVAWIGAAISDPGAEIACVQSLMDEAATQSLDQRKAAFALAYERVSLLKAGLGAVSTALWSFANEYPLTLSDGRIYGAVERPETKLDGRKTRDVLAKVYNPDVADMACAFEATQASVERGLKGILAKQLAEHREAKAHGSKEKKPSLAGLKRAALAEIAKAGGVNVTIKRSTRLHRVAEGGEVVFDSTGSEGD